MLLYCILCFVCVIFFFFFSSRRRHTRLQGDWSSDVCSSDLGKLVALAVTAPRRMQQLPEVPTMAEAGYADFDVTFWAGLLAPAGTPPAIVNRLYEASRGVLQDARDRKSTRLNSSHLVISYAVFCLNK